MIFEKDLVLVHVDEKPGFYARVEDISPDMKKGWWLVKLLVLTFPLQIFSWILDETQLDGFPFTMSGTPLRLEKLVSPLDSGVDEPAEEIKPEKKIPPPDAGQKVVSLASRRKK
jgi:hypothetical protein